ncbi:hypothetical protein SAMN06296036_116117 [Pseudobacteriovorax antillogorgiicola]|uniref:Uncharacterized protein n=1 Tax=Pseudobacteriovorax antillogorgiicola TaxID=1513793 RepID=A0A1Y6CFB9_9BACT|nr:hypothetical protein EDD56_11637 [Pseudobacteriovorax antillogorgiicola]SMF53328.1 hypothetical protein SAMN06296036_116117 [Pseudobacteriovorax antillogorgiicola]
MESKLKTSWKEVLDLTGDFSRARPFSGLTFLSLRKARQIQVINLFHFPRNSALL